MSRVPPSNPAACDLVQCAACAVMAQGVASAALPAGWDAMLIPGDGLLLFCDRCVAGGHMEQARALAGLPRQQCWRYPAGIMALYRPGAQDILLATPDGMAALGEGDARALMGALANALAASAGARAGAVVRP